MKALFAGDPELNSAYQHCDNFLHTIQKAFEEEAAGAKNNCISQPSHSYYPPRLVRSVGDEGITGPEPASTSPFIGSGSVPSASAKAISVLHPRNVLGTSPRTFRNYRLHRNRADSSPERQGTVTMAHYAVSEAGSMSDHAQEPRIMPLL